MKRCSFIDNGPVRCKDEATSLVHHRYGMGWYCESHADWVQNSWRPEPDEVPTMVPLQRRTSAASARRR